MPAHPLSPLLDLPGVARAVDEVREACTELRWHPGLRRGWRVARAEAGVRCAWGGLSVDGLSVPVSLVRLRAAGVDAGWERSDDDGGAARAAVRTTDPVEEAVRGALRVQAAVSGDWGQPGAPSARVPLAQLLARLHTAAVADSGSARLRVDEPPGDLRGLGPAPVGAELAARIAALADLDAAPVRGDGTGLSRGTDAVPGLVVASVLLGELLTLRPFASSNGVVARAVFRRRLTADGVDAVGVVVPEVAWAAAPLVHLSAAAGYATGTTEGVAAWLRHCAGAVLAGASEGAALAAEVSGAG